MKKILIVLAAIMGLSITGCPSDDADDDPSLTVVTLNPSTLTLDVDKTERIIATTVPANTALTWKSSNEAVAIVNTSGYVSGVSEGSATITATAADGGKDTCAVTVVIPTSNYTAVEGQTLVHYTPQLRGVNHFGSDLGTNNSDGSYTFNGTEAAWGGGGAQYAFPTPGPNATWNLSDYQVVEVHLLVTDGSVTAAVKQYGKTGDGSDLKPYPNNEGSNNIAFNKTTNGGKFTFKTVIGEAGNGIGFQRNTGGAATVAIEKVVFSKVNVHTITFEGGEYTEMPAIEPIKIPTGRIVNFSGSYTLLEPEWAEHSFEGWQIKNSIAFEESTPITSDITLVAQWEDGNPVQPDMGLNLDPATWDKQPPTITNPGTAGTGWTTYAATDYENDKLILTFSGINRQRGVIPLSNKQIRWLMRSDVTSITYRIVGAAYKDDGTTKWNADDTTVATNLARFRVHLANPGLADGVGNGTSNIGGSGVGIGDDQSVNIDNLVHVVTVTTPKTQANLSYFVIQSMFGDPANQTTTQQAGAAINLGENVKFIIESITIDIGDTTQ